MVGLKSDSLKLKSWNFEKYEAENWFAGVIFESKQNDHKSFSKFHFFGFLESDLRPTYVQPSCVTSFLWYCQGWNFDSDKEIAARYRANYRGIVNCSDMHES